MRRMIKAAWGMITYGPFVALAVAVALFAYMIYMAGDGFYRYQCQDPAMWSDQQCLPPVCEASGTCTDYLIERGGVTNEG